MKRTLLACVLCSALLSVGIFVLMPRASAQEHIVPIPTNRPMVFPPSGWLPGGPNSSVKKDVAETLLSLPAPPPPNPLDPIRVRDEKFYDPKNPPADNAPIEDLIDYWTRQGGTYRGVLYYLPRPSDKVLERLLTEGGHTTVAAIAAILPGDKRTSEMVRELYDDPSTPTNLKGRLREYLKYNSPLFKDELERSARGLKDVNNYVAGANQNALLALVRQDWDIARPIVERLYNDNSQPVSRALATWALYRHAMDTGSLSDIDRYRTELMRMVEDRSLSDGTRDMANDAIVREPDFPGRDEWSWSLFEDETLVNMPYFTGLTTLMMYSPADKYVAKMAEFLRSNNKTVRTAAARNLMVAYDRGRDPEIVRALLPWIQDPKFVNLPADDGNRGRLVEALAEIKMPESVPALIAALDERAVREVTDYSAFSGNGNMNANVSVVIANTARFMNSNIANANISLPTKQETYYPLRSSAVRALAKQADGRAVPALRRLLSAGEEYERVAVMQALLACGGFTIQEQVEALEQYARLTATVLSKVEDGSESDVYSSTINTAKAAIAYQNIFEGRDMQMALGLMVMATTEPSDGLIRATIDRIDALEPKEFPIAQTMRAMIVNWNGLAVSALLLRDLKNGRSEIMAVLRLLAERKTLAERLPDEVSAAGTGVPTAAGIAACILEDASAYDAILGGKNDTAKIAMFACGRLIRARLPVSKVTGYLRSANEKLSSAAELYLESEDSPAARAALYAKHPGEAMILGATTAFKGKADESNAFLPLMQPIFASVGGHAALPPFMYRSQYEGVFAKAEMKLQKEVKEESGLMGLYAYDNNFVRIYKDRIAFSWENDPSRYHERNLTGEEFNRFKDLITANNAAEMKPFLSCFNNDCVEPKQLLMLGRNGGSRVFVRTSRQPKFFVELERMLAEFRSEPAVIKYSLSKQLPGLELLFAVEGLEAHTVWKQSSDLRVAVSNVRVREKVEEEIALLEEEESEEDEDVGPDDAPQVDSPEILSPAAKMRERREYEGFAWYRLENGKLTDTTAQPPNIDFLPSRDSHDVQPDREQWKARGAGFEVRVNGNGLYKIANGRQTRLKAGHYSYPVISGNGRWLVVTKHLEDRGPELVRIDLTTNREYKVSVDEYGNLRAHSFVPAVNRFLVVTSYYHEDEHDHDDVSDDDEVEQTEPADVERYGRQVYLLDAGTGTMSPVTGEVGPLTHQTFRSLQPTGRPNEFWAALPTAGRNETAVGTYDSRTFRFKQILKLPKIAFNSMAMWVDEGENKVYFVYNGHLLRIPLRAAVKPVR